MAGQHPSRRQVLQALGLAATAASAEGFCRWNWAFAQTSAHHHTGSSVAAPRRATVYKPVFFAPAQYAAVTTLAELILPATGAHAGAAAKGRVSVPVKPSEAGAIDAGVPEFIDFMVSQDVSLQQPFKDGLQWMDTSAGGNGFTALSPAQQTALLERVSYRKNFQAGDEPGQSFFLLVRRYTVMGFYTSRIGLESLDYPGLRFYAESPAVPKDDFLKTLGA